MLQRETLQTNKLLLKKKPTFGIIRTRFLSLFCLSYSFSHCSLLTDCWLPNADLLFILLFTMWFLYSLGLGLQIRKSSCLQRLGQRREKYFSFALESGISLMKNICFLSGFNGLHERHTFTLQKCTDIWLDPLKAVEKNLIDFSGLWIGTMSSFIDFIF